MRVIIKFSPEIIIKSRSVRIFFVKVLVANIKVVLQQNHQECLIIRHWDYLEFKCNNAEKLTVLLQNIPGIHCVCVVKKYVFSLLQDIYKNIIYTDLEKLQNKAFCVRVKRCGNHGFTSRDVECYLGEKICATINNTYVSLTCPEEIISLEIKDDYFFIIIKRYKGLGGLPMGTQQELLSLISGGFDSVVSSYMLMRRGCKVHYCCFNFGEAKLLNEEVCKIAYYLWNRFGSSHTVKFISVDFSEVIKEITVKIRSNHVGVVLKRMMVRAASAIASHFKIYALLTGEVLGQVSSQTLDNLHLIDCVSNCTIFRPLIAYDKEKIIALARKIGTEKFSKVVPEYCATVVQRSTIKTTKECVECEESHFNFLLLEQAIVQAHILDIRDVVEKMLYQRKSFFDIKVQTVLCCDDIVLDIRTKNEQDKTPLLLDNIKVQNIPFYKLNNEFSQLDQDRTYLLYCSHGIMSRLQAIHLCKQGFFNVKIYRPNVLF